MITGNPAVDVVRQYMKPLVRKHSIDGVDLAVAAVKNIPTPQVDVRDYVFHRIRSKEVSKRSHPYD